MNERKSRTREVAAFCTLASAKEPVSFVLGAVQDPEFLCTLRNMRNNSGASEVTVNLSSKFPPVA
jgi:hypothetical protein